MEIFYWKSNLVSYNISFPDQATQKTAIVDQP